jgi:glycosyltransferase involved in cell wall biosynthesis
MSTQLPEISVIVRTAQRDPVFLRRALGSIRAQTVPPGEIVVFNGGGKPEVVEAAIRASDLTGILVTTRHNPPLGQAAAANQAVQVARGTWIAFLDDDDTWAPAFLEHTTRMLVQEGAAADFGGVVTQTESVFERLIDGQPREHTREPFNSALKTIDLAALAVQNRFTNNALVFSRTAFAATGPFREDLAVLYDWEFNVRLAAKFRLEVVPEMLARYHQRPADDPAPNTSLEEHARMQVRIRNEWLRADLAAGRLGLGQLALTREVRGLRTVLADFRRWRNQCFRRMGGLFR